MREIKFRAFVKEEKKMYPVLALYRPEEDPYPVAISDCGNEGCSICDTYLAMDDVEIMQYTGFTDKEGEEIYEGDVIRIYNDEIDEGDSWIDVVSYHMGGYFSGDEDLLGNLHFRARVIGNIYENPELLER